MARTPSTRRIAAVFPAAAAAVLAVAALAAAVPAAAGAMAPAVSYTFRKLDNSNDLTFNQLLGINRHGKIAGYFGSGAPGHKNKGYLLKPPYTQSNYVVENYPNSAQTQVTGLNDLGVTVGFYSHTNRIVNADYGFYRLNGHYHTVVFPTSNNSNPPVNQLLGVNDSGIAVGFYQDSSFNYHGYLYDIFTNKFTPVSVAKSASVVVTGINNNGNVTRYFTPATGPIKAFLRTHTGHLYILAVSGEETQAFGVNDHNEVVGATTVGTSTYGFTWTPAGGFKTVNDPKGVGSTVINGVNDAGDLVGFYTGGNGNTNGMLAIP